MAVRSSKIIQSDPVRGGVRLQFIHVLDTGATLGPFVEDRPAKEDINAFVDTHGAAITVTLTSSEADKQLATQLEKAWAVSILKLADTDLQAVLKLQDAGLLPSAKAKIEAKAAR